jgi:hypothetical protein
VGILLLRGERAAAKQGRESFWIDILAAGRRHQGAPAGVLTRAEAFRGAVGEQDGDTAERGVEA